MDYDYRALRVHETKKGHFGRRIEKLNTRDLPRHEVLVRVEYSAINYKDALAAYGNRGVVKDYPMTPGIDASGIVEESASPHFAKGKHVIIAGSDLGINTPGGFGEFIRVPPSWIIPMPEWCNLKESMIIGGRGFTAGLSVMNLIEQGVKPSDGPVLVTGAAGGVGSWSVLILKKLGYKVVAGTSSLEDSQSIIKKLGADEHVDNSVINETSGKALLKWKWAGAIDNVGGNVLSTALRACKPGGTVTCCGNILSPSLNMTVYPFILNAVKLIGISAPDTSPRVRKIVWDKFRDEYRVSLPDIVTEIGLDQLPAALERTINKKSRGQVLLRHDHIIPG
jgi:acrylyl-CoA reductase (NADPH)